MIRNGAARLQRAAQQGFQQTVEGARALGLSLAACRRHPETLAGLVFPAAYVPAVQASGAFTPQVRGALSAALALSTVTPIPTYAVLAYGLHGVGADLDGRQLLGRATVGLVLRRHPGTAVTVLSTLSQDRHVVTSPVGHGLSHAGNLLFAAELCGRWAPLLRIPALFLAVGSLAGVKGVGVTRLKSQ